MSELHEITHWGTRRSVIWAVLALTLAAGAAAYADAPVFDLGSGFPVEAAVAVDELAMEPGGTGILPIRLAFPGTHHLSSQPTPSFAVKEPSGLTVGKVELQGDHHFDEFLEIEVYKGLVTVMVELSAPSSMSGQYTLKGELTYYPCSDADLMCFEQVDPVQVKLRVEEGASAVVSGVSSDGEVGAAGGLTPLEDRGSTLAKRIKDSFTESIWLAYLLVFLGGILASFTPCVYPMIPITVAVIGAGSAGSKSRGFWLSLIYVLGIAITYSIFGAAAAGTGKAFGSFTQTFPVLLALGLLLGVLGAAMFGFFEIQPPAFLTKLQSKRGQGLVGIFLMGAVAGLVASPCLGPVLLALLALIADTGDVFRGFTLLFVFALGMGLLLIAIGTFAGALTALPKSGNWMVRIRELLGLILAGVGVYYLGLALATKGVPEKATWTVTIGLVLAVVGFLVKGSDERATEEAAAPAVSGVKQFVRKGVGVVMVVVGAYSAIVGLSMGGFSPSWVGSLPVGSPGTAGQGVVWSDSYDAYEEEMEWAREEKRPVMIDFYTVTCVYCKKLDSNVFTDERVIEESERFATVKIDGDQRKDLVRNYAVLGFPTIILLNSAGSEATRIVGYVNADRFLEVMKTVN